MTCLPNIVVLNEGFKLRSSWNGHIKSLGGEETFWVKQIKEVIVD